LQKYFLLWKTAVFAKWRMFRTTLIYICNHKFILTPYSPIRAIRPCPDGLIFCTVCTI
jgi:hypothetical protein